MSQGLGQSRGRGQGARWQEGGAAPPLSPKISPPGVEVCTLPGSGEALCFHQVPSDAFGSVPPHVLILPGCCGSPSPGRGSRGDPILSPPFHHRLPSPSFADGCGWGQWPGGRHPWVCPPCHLHSTGQDPRGQTTAATGHPSSSSPTLAPLSAVTFLRLHPTFILSKTWSCQD